MKKGRGKSKREIKINLHLSNKWLYTFIALGIILALSVGVYAVYPASGAGHNANEIDFSTGINTNLNINIPSSSSPIGAMSVDVQSFTTGTNALASYFFRVRDIGASSTPFYIRGDGNVGIGTTTPGAKLDIAGTIKITGGSPGAGKVLTSDADGLASWTTAGSSQWATTSVGDLYFMGKVGIGTAPNAKLEVNGQIKIDGGSPGVGKVLTSDANGLGSWATLPVGNLISNKVCKSNAGGTAIDCTGGSLTIDGILTTQGIISGPGSFSTLTINGETPGNVGYMILYYKEFTGAQGVNICNNICASETQGGGSPTGTQLDQGACIAGYQRSTYGPNKYWNVGCSNTNVNSGVTYRCLCVNTKAY